MSITQSQPDNDVDMSMDVDMTQHDNADPNKDKARSTSSTTVVEIDNTEHDQCDSNNTENENNLDNYDLDHREKYLTALKEVSDEDINSLQIVTMQNYRFTYALEKSVKFPTGYGDTTPANVLRSDVRKARDIILGKCDDVILNDKVVLMEMTTLDEDTIVAMSDEQVNLFLSTYARQYNVKFNSDYYTTTCLEQKRIQLQKSLDEYRSQYLQHEPILTITENTTNVQIKRMSTDMARHVLAEYAQKCGVTFPPNFLTKSTNYHQLIDECIKIRDRK